MNSKDPHLTDIGLAFQLPCAGISRTFVISIEALEILSRRCNYTMDPLNLYRAHEAIIHVVARLIALEEKSDTPILMNARHFRDCSLLEPSSTSQRSRLAA